MRYMLSCSHNSVNCVCVQGVPIADISFFNAILAVISAVIAVVTSALSVAVDILSLVCESCTLFNTLCCTSSHCTWVMRHSTARLQLCTL